MSLPTATTIVIKEHKPKPVSLVESLSFSLRRPSSTTFLFSKNSKRLPLLYPSCSQNVVPGATASTGSLLEMRILRPQPRPIESEFLGLGPTRAKFRGPLFYDISWKCSNHFLRANHHLWALDPHTNPPEDTLFSDAEQGPWMSSLCPPDLPCPPPPSLPLSTDSTPAWHFLPGSAHASPSRESCQFLFPKLPPVTHLAPLPNPLPLSIFFPIAPTTFYLFTCSLCLVFAVCLEWNIHEGRIFVCSLHTPNIQNNAWPRGKQSLNI